MSDATLGDFDDGGRVLKATGPPDHWLTTVNTGIWGVEAKHEGKWNDLDSGDVVLFHSTGKDTEGGPWPSRVVGYGVVASKERKEYPLWRTEKKAEANEYPYIFHFSETAWRGDLDRISERDISTKSHEEVHEEIDALTENGLSFSEIEAELDYKFPAMGAFSGVNPDVLDLLRGGEMTRVRYRTVGERTAEEPPADVDTDRDVTDLLSNAEVHPPSDEELFDGLFFPKAEKERIESAVGGAIAAGKHVIFTGPPGTGKTELAENVCAALVGRNVMFTDHRLSTATADWSTFDTVGGYMPGESGDGSLEFKPGQVLKRVLSGEHARNELLVIDEINRADIDKAFGQLFTVLSGQGVQLPFERDSREVEILPSEEYDPTEPLGTHQYVVPDSWRMFATMNSYDKTSLYEMSYAFMRRFTFIRIGPPPASEVAELLPRYVAEWDVEPSPEDEQAATDVWAIMNDEGREIGPAIVKDMLGMMVNVGGSQEARTTQAVVSYVLPQLEGVPDRERIVRSLVGSDYVDEEALFEVATEMLQIRPTDG